MTKVRVAIFCFASDSALIAFIVHVIGSHGGGRPRLLPDCSMALDLVKLGCIFARPQMSLFLYERVETAISLNANLQEKGTDVHMAGSSLSKDALHT